MHILEEDRRATWGPRPIGLWATALLAVVTWAMPSPAATKSSPAVEGYDSYDALQTRLRRLDTREGVTREILARTLGGREIALITISDGLPDQRPAVLVLGGLHPPHLLGSQLAVAVAERLTDPQRSEPLRRLRDRCTIYVIPRAAPDAAEAFFRRPYHARLRNERPTDDDGDGRIDEDGPVDLDGDGWITQLRIEDPRGPWTPHPQDPRILVKADPTKNERGRYLLAIESRDTDGDERLGEDPPGGVAFDRNFPFQYPYFGEAAGPYAVSEPETKALADFAFDHPNIAAVFSFSPDENLTRMWKVDSAADAERIKTTLPPADAVYLRPLAEEFHELLGKQKAPEWIAPGGSPVRWAYFQFGRWSLASRGWWPALDLDDAKGAKPEDAADGDRAEPGVTAERHQDDADVEKADAARKSQADAPDDSRGEAERAALKWLEARGIDGFADWTRIEHPDLPGRKVEVGGFKTFRVLNPPADRIDELAERHVSMLALLAEKLPTIGLEQVRAESLGGGVWRVSAEVVNTGHLPTTSAMGEITDQPLLLQVELVLRPGVELVTGTARRALDPLAGSVGREEQSWLVRVTKGRPPALKLRVWSPSVGETEARVKLADE